MESLLVVLFFWALVTFARKQQDQKKKKAALSRQNQLNAQAAPAEQAAQPEQAAQSAQAVRAAPPQPAEMLPRLEREPLRPSPHDHSGMFDGSLLADADSPEGRDPHEHGFEQEVSMPSDVSDQVINASLAAEGTEAGAAPVLRLTPESVREAFILQEVLKRRSR